MVLVLDHSRFLQVGTQQTALYCQQRMAAANSHVNTAKHRSHRYTQRDFQFLTSAASVISIASILLRLRLALRRRETKPLRALQMHPSCRLGDQAITDIQVAITSKLHRVRDGCFRMVWSAMPACLGHHSVGLQKSLDALQPLNLLHIGGQEGEATVL